MSRPNPLIAQPHYLRKLVEHIDLPVRIDDDPLQLEQSNCRQVTAMLAQQHLRKPRYVSRWAGRVPAGCSRRDVKYKFATLRRSDGSTGTTCLSSIRCAQRHCSWHVLRGV